MKKVRSFSSTYFILCDLRWGAESVQKFSKGRSQTREAQNLQKIKIIQKILSKCAKCILLSLFFDKIWRQKGALVCIVLSWVCHEGKILLRWIFVGGNWLCGFLGYNLALHIMKQLQMEQHKKSNTPHLIMFT